MEVVRPGWGWGRGLLTGGGGGGRWRKEVRRRGRRVETTMEMDG